VKKILTMLEVVDDAVIKAWLQHVRDFDKAHPRCRFEILMQSGDTMTTEAAVKMLGDVTPPIPVRAVMKKRKESKR
jgi:hypothetical protein